MTQDQFIKYISPLNSDSSSLQTYHNRAWLLLFYADWCDHCKAFKPVWKDFAQRYQNHITQSTQNEIDVQSINSQSDLEDKLQNQQQLGLAMINCKDSPDVCTLFDIDGYPSLKVIRGKYSYEYEGEGTAEGLLKYAKDYQNQIQELDAKQERVEIAEALFVLICQAFEYAGFGEISAAAKIGGSFIVIGLPLFVICILWAIGDIPNEEESQNSIEQQKKNK
eukprot:403363492